MGAMLRGDRSTFDRTAWADMAAPKQNESRWPGFAAALRSTMQDFIRLARLVQLTRRVQQQPGDKELRSEATSLASRLFGHSSLETWTGELLRSGAIAIVPSSSVNDSRVVPRSFRFQSPRLYHLLVAAWTGRVILCGCIHTLATCSGRGVPSSLNVEAARAADVQAAERIAMCMEYCLLVDATMPAAQMVQLSPLATAFGAWQRLEERDFNSGLGGAAGNMMSWCAAMVNGIEMVLSLRLSTREGLVRRAVCLAGGPTVESSPAAY